MSIPKLKKTCEVLGVSSDRILWDKDVDAIPLEERMMHLDEETQQLLHKMLTIQLEIIELSKKMGRAEAESEASLKVEKPKKAKKK